MVRAREVLVCVGCTDRRCRRLLDRPRVFDTAAYVAAAGDRRRWCLLRRDGGRRQPAPSAPRVPPKQPRLGISPTRCSSPVAIGEWKADAHSQPGPRNHGQPSTLASRRHRRRSVARAWCGTGRSRHQRGGQLGPRDSRKGREGHSSGRDRRRATREVAGGRSGASRWGGRRSCQPSRTPCSRLCSELTTRAESHRRHLDGRLLPRGGPCPALPGGNRELPFFRRYCSLRRSSRCSAWRRRNAVVRIPGDR